MPEANLIALAGGEEVEGFRVEHTPGHASHHLCYLDLDAGDAYVGDMAGVRIPPGELHPGADAAARDRRRGLARLGRPDRGAWPERLRLTHFGAAEDVGAQLERLRESLRRERRARPARARERSSQAYEAEIDAQADPETAGAGAPGEPARAAVARARALLAQAREAAERPAVKFRDRIPFRSRRVFRVAQRLRCREAGDPMRNLKLTRSAARARGGGLAGGCAWAARWRRVTVYDNDFSSRAEFTRDHQVGRRQALRPQLRARRASRCVASVKRSPTTCSFRPPVQGDDELPNHDVDGRGQDPEEDAEGLRGGAFVELTVRAGGGGVGYTLRVFPQKQAVRASTAARRAPAFPVAARATRSRGSTSATSCG